MRRYDLRHLHDDFYDRMVELIDSGLKAGEVGIFMFEIGDFSSIQKSADLIKEQGHDLMNSIKFNEVDWTIVVKKVDDTTKKARAQAAQEAKEAAKIAAAEQEAKEKAAAETAQKAAKEKEEAEKAATEKLAIEGAQKKAAEEQARKEAEAEAALALEKASKEEVPVKTTPVKPAKKPKDKTSEKAK